MKLNYFLVISSFCFLALGVAQETGKSAHQHHTKHNGKMLMLGDVHFEVTGDASMLMIYYFDKFGDELKTNAIEVNLSLVEGTKSKELKFDKDKKISNLIHVTLPKDVNKNDAEVVIKAKNIDMPKGQVVPGTIVKFDLKNL